MSGRGTPTNSSRLDAFRQRRRRASDPVAFDMNAERPNPSSTPPPSNSGRGTPVAAAAAAAAAGGGGGGESARAMARRVAQHSSTTATPTRTTSALGRSRIANVQAAAAAADVNPPPRPGAAMAALMAGEDVPGPGTADAESKTSVVAMGAAASRAAHEAFCYQTSARRAAGGSMPQSPSRCAARSPTLVRNTSQHRAGMYRSPSCEVVEVSPPPRPPGAPSPAFFESEGDEEEEEVSEPAVNTQSHRGSVTFLAEAPFERDDRRRLPSAMVGADSSSSSSGSRRTQQDGAKKSGARPNTNTATPSSGGGGAGSRRASDAADAASLATLYAEVYRSQTAQLMVRLELIESDGRRQAVSDEAVARNTLWAHMAKAAQRSPPRGRSVSELEGGGAAAEMTRAEMKSHIRALELGLERARGERDEAELAATETERKLRSVGAAAAAALRAIVRVNSDDGRVVAAAMRKSAGRRSSSPAEGAAAPPDPDRGLEVCGALVAASTSADIAYASLLSAVDADDEAIVGAPDTTTDDDCLAALHDLSRHASGSGHLLRELQQLAAEQQTADEVDAGQQREAAAKSHGRNALYRCQAAAVRLHAATLDRTELRVVFATWKLCAAAKSNARDVDDAAAVATADLRAQHEAALGRACGLAKHVTESADALGELQDTVFHLKNCRAEAERRADRAEAESNEVSERLANTENRLRDTVTTVALLEGELRDASEAAKSRSTDIERELSHAEAAAAVAELELHAQRHNTRRAALQRQQILGLVDGLFVAAAAAAPHTVEPGVGLARRLCHSLSGRLLGGTAAAAAAPPRQHHSHALSLSDAAMARSVMLRWMCRTTRTTFRPMADHQRQERELRDELRSCCDLMSRLDSCRALQGSAGVAEDSLEVTPMRHQPQHQRDAHLHQHRAARSSTEMIRMSEQPAAPGSPTDEPKGPGPVLKQLSPRQQSALAATALRAAQQARRQHHPAAAEFPSASSGDILDSRARTRGAFTRSPEPRSMAGPSVAAVGPQSARGPLKTPRGAAGSAGLGAAKTPRGLSRRPSPSGHIEYGVAPLVVDRAGSRAAGPSPSYHRHHHHRRQHDGGDDFATYEDSLRADAALLDPEDDDHVSLSGITTNCGLSPSRRGGAQPSAQHHRQHRAVSPGDL